MKIEQRKGKVHVTVEQGAPGFKPRWEIKIDGYGGHGLPEVLPQRFEIANDVVLDDLLVILSRVQDAIRALT